MAGASAVAIGTGLYVDPYTPLNVIDGIKEFMRAEGFMAIAEIRHWRTPGSNVLKILWVRTKSKPATYNVAGLLNGRGDRI